MRASNTSKVTSIILVWITLVGDYEEAGELEAANPTLCGGESVFSIISQAGQSTTELIVLFVRTICDVEHPACQEGPRCRLGAGQLYLALWELQSLVHLAHLARSRDMVQGGLAQWASVIQQLQADR